MRAFRTRKNPTAEACQNGAHRRLRVTALLGAGGVASALALAPIAAQAQPASSSADDTWATPWAQKVPDSLLATH
ncbi:MAG TPA: hypothetical protein VFL99_09590, partial [Segeticoccus sp.]|uniref:hypothetical protein n=1 Tax=Segeticoccus sp. TaxID=2706531 RepID=UPI002D802013